MAVSAKKMQNKTTLVIGAGIAGATAARQLAQAGGNVLLIENKAAIGGHASQMGCKATDHCLRCNVCVANDIFKRVLAYPGIQIFTRTEIVRLEPGRNGFEYTAYLAHQPVFIDSHVCIGCNVCRHTCPQKCIDIAAPVIAGSKPVINYPNCLRAKGKNCLKCQDACPVDAIDMNRQARQSSVQVNNIIIATGYDEYNPAENNSFGYRRVPNVITGTEAERQLAAQQKITRPSDGQAPKRIAFVQCVGSRTEEINRRPEDTDYCSTVCCAYALRMAQLMKHQAEDSDITIFYMDIQKFGKDFDKFYNQCKASMNFVRSRPYEINPGPEETVSVKYTPQSGLSEQKTGVCQDSFDLVVLAVGIRPSANARYFADKLLVPLDQQGFFGIKNASAIPDMMRDGIFVAGAAESPKDIAGCIAQAEAVTAAVISKDNEGE